MKPKAKRKLSNIDFSKESAHIALCHKDQGVANGADYALVLKSGQFSDEFIEKIQQVKVTMELPDFISRFFNLYEDDADVLAYMMGYVEPAESQADEQMEADSEYRDWIKSKMEAFEIIKQAHENNLTSVMSGLSEDEYLALLNDQSLIEKAISEIDKHESDKKESPKVVYSTKADVTASNVQHEVKGMGNSPVIKQENKETLMTDSVQKTEQVPGVEVIEKAAFDEIQKQAIQTQELLKSALAELEVFKAEKAALITKARKQSIGDVVKDEAKAELLFKSIESLDDDKFNSVVDVIKGLAEQLDKSDMFVEKGFTVNDQEKQDESPVAKMLKAKYSK